jgi:hypothetical protein
MYRKTINLRSHARQLLKQVISLSSILFLTLTLRDSVIATLGPSEKILRACQASHSCLFFVQSKSQSEILFFASLDLSPVSYFRGG